MKRYALLLTAALGMAAAQTPPASARPAAASAPQLADTQLSSQAVSINTGTFRGPLSVLLVGIAKAAGYEIIFDMNVDALPLVQGRTENGAAPATAATGGVSGTALSYDSNVTAKPLAYNLVNRPFNQVWPLLMDVYGLSYNVVQVGDGKILRVGNSPVQRNLKLPAGLRATDVEPRLKIFFGSRKTISEEIETGNGKVTRQVPSDEITLDSPTLRIVAEPASNSIIVRGTSTEVLEVERLFQEMVSAQTPGQNVPVLQRTYKAKTDAGSLRLALLDQFPTLRVTSVTGSGQLILSGTQPQIDAALALLAQIDGTSADPSTTAPPIQRVYSVKGQQADITALLGAQYPALKVTPVGQTGQLVITGQPGPLDAALALLAQVDRAAPPPQAGPQTVQRVFQLVNASAEEVKATLEGTLAREVDDSGIGQNLSSLPTTLLDVNGNPINVALPPSSSTGSGSSAGTQTAGASGTATRPATQAVTLIADKRTNTLIARGTEAQVRQIAELIPQLDQVVPQVNVQVRIQEITEDAGRSLGVDWKVGFGGFNVSLGGSGLGATFDPTRSLMGFNVFPTLQAQENQGLSKRVYDGSITMQSGQRSLGANGSTQNSSNSAAATIKSGGRLELNIPSMAANVPPIQKQIDYGVNLDFFDPQVAPDGKITLRVRGQVNTLNSTITPSSVPNVLDFANSEAQTTITFKSGQTVLLSGLLGNTESTGRTGVPFLSSLPVVGGLFSKQSTTKKASQLLVVITGNVVK